MTRTPTVYRFYGADDRLLYVGMSINPARRIDQHRTKAAWWKLAIYYRLTAYETTAEAAAEERRAIRYEKPAFNKRWQDSAVTKHPLRLLREDRLISQEELSEAIGASHGVISHYEVGRSKPRAQTTRRIAEVLGVPHDQITACFGNSRT